MVGSEDLILWRALRERVLAFRTVTEAVYIHRCYATNTEAGALQTVYSGYGRAMACRAINMLLRRAVQPLAEGDTNRSIDRELRKQDPARGGLEGPNIVNPLVHGTAKIYSLAFKMTRLLVAQVRRLTPPSPHRQMEGCPPIPSSDQESI